MKSFLVTIGYLMLFLLFTACGKKAHEKNKDPFEVDVPQTKGEIYFTAFKEIEDAINKNDLPRLQKTYANNSGIHLDDMLTEGETFLSKAIKNDYIGIRDFLLDRYCDPQKANINKETPLMVAVKYNRLNSVKVLLDLDVDLNRKSVNGDTALHIAIKNRNEEIALILINHKADIDEIDGSDKNAYRLSHDYKLNKVEERIQQIEYGVPDIIAFKNLVTEGDASTLKVVISRFPSITNEYESINPLALITDVKDDVKAISSALILIEGRANVNGPKDAEITPLIKATKGSKNHLAKLFLEKNADPQLLDKDGKSALIHAIEINNLELVQVLLEKSALEVYTFRKDGKKITFDACKVAKETSGRQETKEDKARIKDIQHALDCGLFSWLF